VDKSTLGGALLAAAGVVIVVAAVLWLLNRGGFRSRLVERWFAWWAQRQGTPSNGRVAFAIPAYGAIVIGLVYVVAGVRQVIAP
jgi:hypothetical protein